jgi:uncharacterized Fe-S radical SAM superfamily protein PflX
MMLYKIGCTDIWEVHASSFLRVHPEHGGIMFLHMVLPQKRSTSKLFYWILTTLNDNLSVNVYTQAEDKPKCYTSPHQGTYLKRKCNFMN